MSRNSGHYLKPARKVTVPSAVFTIVVDTADVKPLRTDVYSERVFKAASATFTRRRNSKWSIPKVIETDDPDCLRRWVEAHADPKRRNYIICPIASDVLTLTKWWHHVETVGCRFERGEQENEGSNQDDDTGSQYVVRRLILRGKPDIFDYSRNDRRYIWLSGAQYIDADIASIASQVGYGAEDGIFADSSDSEKVYTTTEIALIWSQLFCHLSNWWQEVATAPFGLTVGGLSMGILRSHIPKKALSTHNDTYAHNLERTACYGGRASVWYVGTIGDAPALPIHGVSSTGQSIRAHLSGPARLIDVRSMYPYLLSDCMYPCGYAGRIGAISGQELASLCDHYGVIASVTISSKIPEYPKRINGRITYPTGYFQTVLAGPEIQRAHAEGSLLQCHDGALYTIGRPFAAAAQTLLDMRVTARASGNDVWETFAKAVGNNLGGKLAQRKSYQRPRPNIAPQRQWGEWIVTRVGEDNGVRYCAYAGLVYENVKDESGYGPYTPAFAYLTAYGRLMMRDLREKCPPETVVSQDTDGIWIVGDEAYNILVSRTTFGDNPGELQIKEETESATFMSPRHYYTDKGWTLAGFHEHQFDVQKMQVEDTYTQNPITIGARSSPKSLITKSRISRLTLEHCGGEITPYGWTIPVYYPPPRDI